MYVCVCYSCLLRQVAIYVPGTLNVSFRQIVELSWPGLSYGTMYIFKGVDHADNRWRLKTKSNIFIYIS